MQSALSSDFKSSPFWWEEAPLRPANEPLPSRADVAIVGAGYCGLMAALTLARAGRTVVVLDAKDPGFGASSRNHGHIGASGGKIPYDIIKRLGEERASQVWRDSARSVKFFKDFLESEKLNVDFVQRGRFQGAHSAAAFKQMAKTAEQLRSKMGVNVRVVDRVEQRAEIGSDYYYGGMVFEDGGALHPAKLHREFRRLAEEAGVLVRGNAAVSDVIKIGREFELTTARGKVTARDVIIATNAYTGTLTPWLRRRIVPVTAYMAATQELSADLAHDVLPTNRTGGDTKRALYAFRRSPSGRRLIFAGRAKFSDTTEADAAQILHGFMSGVWPQLRGSKITHCWKGFVAFTFDFMTHMGMHNGMHYASGCQGSGVVLMTYLGRQMALKILGQQAEPCGFELANFPTIPTYTGKPWFLPAIGAYYRARDSIDRMVQ